MVEIQKPHSALKRPSLKRETVVVNNSAPTIKKVTLVPKDEVSDDTQQAWDGAGAAFVLITQLRIA